MDLCVDVTPAATSYQTNPDFSVEWETDYFIIANKSTTASDIVYFSFDGVTDHGVLIPGVYGWAKRNEKRKRVWTRCANAGSVDVNIAAFTVR